MKTSLFNYITLLAMLLTAIPAKSQNYLKLWFKDGHTERHFMHLVQGISTTKYDLKGNLHADYQMQQIVMPDTTYSYYIADIDSMSFKKVDEEVVYANVIDITNFIRPIFSECKDSASISAYLDEIRNRESVEEVMLTSTNLIVTVKDWLPIIYHFPHEQSMFDGESFQSSINYAKQKRQMLLKQNDDVNTAVPNNVYSFAILNQNSKDESRNYAKDLYDILISDFKAMNISADYKKCEDLTLDFLRTDIFKYDVVYFMSHGSYKDTKHLSLTGEEIGVEGDGSLPWWLDKKNFFSYNIGSIDKGMRDWGEEVPMSCEEIRNGQKVTVWYTAVSSGHFKDDKKAHFDKAHNTIFINASCESLKGNDVLERTINGITQSFKGNSEMAKVFTEKKNCDVYLGYNQKSRTKKDLWFAQYFFEYMLMGYSEEGALNRINNNRNVSVYDIYSDNDLLDQYNPQYKEDSDGNLIEDENGNIILDEDRKNEWFISNLIDIRADQSAASMFIVKTNTGRKIQEDAEKEYAGSGKITIKGYTSMLFENSDIKCGFRYGTDSNLDNFKVVYSEGEECTNSEYGNVQFSGKLNPADLANFEPGQTIYFRAFTFDDVHYNLAEEICSFVIPKLSEDTDTNLDDVPGTDL